MTAPISAMLTIRYDSDWLSSTGGTGSGDADDFVRRDRLGLPITPMSSVRGVLREAAERLAAAKAQGWTGDRVVELFGGRDPSPSKGQLSFPGDARLADNERRAFEADAAAVGGLFSMRPATAIDEATGAALGRTLRTIETAVPMTLTGRISVRDPAKAGEDWPALLDAAAAFALAVGKGKNDGLGRAVLSVTADKAAVAEAVVPAGLSRRVMIRLEQTEKAAFSSVAQTEGLMDTRDCVPGSALLGWAARNYPDFEDAYAVFHGGGVRFGDARPVSASGELLWPMPRVLRRDKTVSAVDGSAILAGDTVRAVAGDDVTYMRVPAASTTVSGAAGFARSTLTVRTAMAEGRPDPGKLFQYRSLAADPDQPAAYVAVMEADAGISDQDWKRLLAAFEGKTLVLGRAAGSGQGGCFRASLVDAPEAMVPAARPHTGRTVVWALSDLAIEDGWGAPALAPGPQLLGLAEKGRLIPELSAVSTRRYAPWRAHLGARDVEHVVIEAGSVLVYDLDDLGEASAEWPSVVGLHQELGLGRIWVDPPLLKNLASVDPAVRGPCLKPPVVAWARKPTEQPKTAHAELHAWTQAREASREEATEAFTEFRVNWLPALNEFYAEDPSRAPSKSNWGDLVEADDDAGRAAVLAKASWKNPSRLRAEGEGREALTTWLLSALKDKSASRTRALLSLARDQADRLSLAARGRPQ